MSYKIDISKRAEKELQSLNNIFLGRMIHAIESLAEEPRPRGAKKLQGAEDGWRIRAGRYRILYSIDDNEKVVFIIRVTDRKEAYRNI